jgi:hypothetical protein
MLDRLRRRLTALFGDEACDRYYRAGFEARRQRAEGSPGRRADAGPPDRETH